MINWSYYILRIRSAHIYFNNIYNKNIIDIPLIIFNITKIIYNNKNVYNEEY